MKKSELFFSFLLVPLDFLAIFLAGISAYHIRFAEITTGIRPAIFNLKFDDYLQAIMIIGVIWLFIFALAGLYSVKRTLMLKEFYKIILACSTGLTVIVVIIFFRRELFESRFIVLAGWIIAIIYLSLYRFLIRFLQTYLYRHGIGVHKVILVGNSKTTELLMSEFSSKKIGFEVVKKVKDFSLETAQEIAEFIKAKPIDEIIQSDPNLSKAEVLRMFDFTDENHITFKYAADLLDTKVLKTEVDEMAGVPIVEVKKTSLDGWGRINKRIFDLFFSSLIILFTSPIMLLTALIIKLDSRGPVFFSTRDNGEPLYRVGQGGQLFKYLKFRSMQPNTDSMRYNELSGKNIRTDGPMVKIKDDPRITRFGKLIRRLSIDELPELFMVFKGNMSLVGPRPHLPEEVAKYEHHHKKVLTIKPGMTGMAQISGRSDLSFEEEVRLDTYYIENWSLLLDLSILLKTPLAVFRSRKTE